MKKVRVLFLPLLFFTSSLFSITIEEKQASFSEKAVEAAEPIDLLLSDVNHQLFSLKKELKTQIAKANELVKKGAQDEEYLGLLNHVQRLKSAITDIEEKWKTTSAFQSKKEEEGYALWDQEETSISALVMEYGAADFLYVIPPEINSMKITLHSNIPLPRESWSDALEILLSHNGIGVKTLNPYARQLYIFKQDPSAISAIASNLNDIRALEDFKRVFYVFSPQPEHVKGAFQFFEKFADPKATFVYAMGGKIALVGTKTEIEKLLTLYATVWKDPAGKISKVVPVTKMSVTEMEKILTSFFGDTIERPGRPPFGKMDSEGLSIFTPSHGNTLVLMGSRLIVDRAEKIVRETEEQLQDPAEMTVFMYACKHSDPNDLAKVLDKVYYSLLHASTETRDSVDVNYMARMPGGGPPPDGYAQSPPLTVPPQRFKPDVSTKFVESEQASEHFIPDPKTGTLLMVVRRDVLQRIKDLLRTLDIPKKMVQIEVLLFEKKLNSQTNYGLNLLKLGNTNGARYDGPNPPKENSLDSPVGQGVLAFLFSGHKSKHFPAFDFAYSFLMTQEDIQLNAAPSVITVNQTPATISILEELSLNNGAAPIDTNKGIAFEKSFTRAQYGITIILTPIIHLPDEENSPQSKGFVTLQTNITFDTTKPSINDRPNVDRRHIENEVRVFDGQTVILGGLRRRATRDNEDKVPFLGEIPGIGKLFGSSHLSDHNTEMFFFITPKIVTDPKEEFLQLRCEDLQKRPGDIPEFLRRLVEARECERQRLFSSSIRAFFGDRQGYYE